MGKPKQNPHRLPAKLETALLALGVPRSSWPGVAAKMSERVVASLEATIDNGVATPATREAYQAWQLDRAQKIRNAKPVEVEAESVETVATVGTADGTLAPDWPTVADIKPFPIIQFNPKT